MFIIDEFDEVLKVTNNQQDLDAIINECLKPQGINPMYALYSATVDEEVQKIAESLINQPTPRIYCKAVENKDDRSKSKNKVFRRFLP